MQRGNSASMNEIMMTSSESKVSEPSKKKIHRNDMHNSRETVLDSENGSNPGGLQIDRMGNVIRTQIEVDDATSDNSGLSMDLN